MTTPEEEDKYGRFERYFDIDIKTIEEAALGGSGADLTNYYTKTQTYNKTEVDDLIAGISGADLSNYYTKAQVDTIVSNKADASSLNNYILSSQKNVNNGVAGLDNNGRTAPENLGANATSTRFLRGDKTWQDLDKTVVGLTNVDNTTDLNKPISTATQTALNAKQDSDADLTSIAGLAPTNNDVIQRKAGVWVNRTPAQLKTDLSLVKGDVGLGNVDNTSDASKPVSTATQTALDGKQALDSDLTALAAISPTNDDIIQRKAGAWTNRTVAQFKTDLSLTKSDVGLGNVDNTSDASKPVSTATQTALDGKQTLDSDLTAIAGLTPTDNDFLQRKSGAWINRTPTQAKTDLSLSKSDVGLGSVDNTSDAGKPVSTAQQTALNLKADISGTPRYLAFSTSWPSRPADSRMTFFIGGSSSTDAPSGAVAGDVWIPAT